MKRFSIFQKLFLPAGVLLMMLGLYRCANVLAPTGGPKDVTPPAVIKSTPANHSTDFKGNRFSITFDEYIKLDKLTQQLLVSPPMAELPDFRIKRKTLILQFKDKLKSNTTYSVFFGDAIQDITEGNPLHNYTYVFSTGSSVDSMSMRGQVVDAEDLKPVDDVYVMLYKKNNNTTISLDSLPLLVKPFYVSKTDKNGNFIFSGLANTSYLIFALQDLNYSMTFDQPAEKIAFLDSLVKPQYRPKPQIDSSLFDTITSLPADSIKLMTDSLWRRADSLADAKLTLYKLYLFQEADTVQKLLKAKLLRENTMQFVFSLPGKNVTIQSLNFHPDNIWHKNEWSKSGDTLLWFLHLPHPDSLNLLFINGKDTLDSLNLRIIPKQKFIRRRKKATLAKKKYLSWKSDIQGVIKPGQKVVLTFGQPVVRILPDSILLVQGKDSLYHPRFTFIDSLHRYLYFPIKIKDATSYLLYLPDSSVIDWNHFYNKKIRLSLHTKALKEYSDLNADLQPKNPGNYIFEILDKSNEKEKPVAIRYFSGKTVLSFPRINPGEYRFKIIFDRNGNNRWDPGNYLKKQLPEKVIYFKGVVILRANWEVNETWKF